MPPPDASVPLPREFSRSRTRRPKAGLSHVWDRLEQVLERFEEAWARGQRPDLSDFVAEGRTPEERKALLFELALLHFEMRLLAGEPARVEEYLERYPDIAADRDVVLDLIDAEREHRLRQEPDLALDEYWRRFAVYAPLRGLPSPEQKIEHGVGPEPRTQNMEGADITPRSAPSETPPTKPEANDSKASLPTCIGRYQVKRILGKGGFGVVYLAHDEKLQRLVAVKVPHAHLVAKEGSAEAYLAEARTVANLDHPNIVPVFDVGCSDVFPCYVVSRYIDGSNLAARIARGRPPFGESVARLATVAEALHYAHRQGLVHRDIKPGNILIDKSGKPFVVDFGLALREQDFGKGPTFAGTPPYMSPEQARGEGHRVDGRTDIFSLGIVLYELLTGRRPFQGESKAELFEQILAVEARPPRQWDETIPKEVERICLKALSKRATDRYTTAKDLADDLRQCQVEVVITPQAMPSSSPPRVEPPTPVPTPAPTATEQSPPRIVPKGLRSYDEADADFFLELLPGARDRDGLPESIRFWKSRIEQTNPDRTFAVGLIYGPSGCGKSSLVNAALLPRLGRSVTVIAVETTAEETETRLLKALHRQVPDLPDNLTLIESLAALRRGRFLKAEQKVLLVLDQLEQWLHAHSGEESGAFVQALRQCDGGRVQALLLVRDDFWLAVSRFMQALEIRIVEGENARLMDLFDPRHARKVLTAFGRAFGALPNSDASLTKEQETFLRQAVDELAEDGKVISVRLALFAEMVKGKPWTPATLKQIGGTGGVGVAFLEETFAASGAPLSHRLHQRAAQAVLRSLLPDAGTNLKGHMRSQKQLLDASGYGSRPKDFDALLHILDSELRLITPTDPEGVTGGAWRVAGESGAAPDVETASAPTTTHHPPPATRFYQLTHDYLVQALRDWLTRMQKETRRGRAEILLADRAAAWNTRPESRQLPSLAQWLQIRCLTRHEMWTPAQATMMRKASRFHGVRALIIILFVTAATTIGLHVRRQMLDERETIVLAALKEKQETHATGFVRQLLDANITKVPEIVLAMQPYREYTNPQLTEALRGPTSPSRKLNASLGMLPGDPSQVEYLFGRMLEAQPQEIEVILEALKPYKLKLTQRLWQAARSESDDHILQAACALAVFDPNKAKWSTINGRVANKLVQVDPSSLRGWQDCLAPAKSCLLQNLCEVFKWGRASEVRRYGTPGNGGVMVSAVGNLGNRASLIDRGAENTSNKALQPEQYIVASILAEYAADEGSIISDLLMDADPKQFAILYPKAKSAGVHLFLAKALTQQLPPPQDLFAREIQARRQANAATILLKMGQAQKVWPLLKHSPDPRVRSYIIDRLATLRVNPGMLLQQLAKESDVSIRRALLLSLGEFTFEQIPQEERELHSPGVIQRYREDPDPGIHAAAEWLLRRWEEGKKVQEITEAWAKDGARRDTRLAPLRPGLLDGKAPPQWYVNGEGLTMVVLPSLRGIFKMGSPQSEEGRDDHERQRGIDLRHSFALAATEITLAQFRRFKPMHNNRMKYTPSDDCPVTDVSWQDAVDYCKWLSKREGIALNDPTGYRLPSEIEWEYACRAGAVTSRYFGESDDVLHKYAWYTRNSQDKGLHPVGRFKPNDFGLFDMLGNAMEWCLEKVAVSDPKLPHRVLRGGSFDRQPENVRCAWRFWYPPTDRNVQIGFRPARTMAVERVKQH
jgi:eukaryotic-like serine/threonine-protein kinase